MKKLILLFALFICSANIVTAQWQPTEGIYGGYVFCTAVSEQNVFVGTNNGVYLSINNGDSWTPANNGNSWTSVNNDLSNWRITSLVISGTNIFALGSHNRGTKSSVFLSTNNGNNWTEIMTTNFFISSLIIKGINIIVGTSGGVFLSNNNGNNWTEINNGLTSLDVSSLTINGATLFAGTYSGGIFYSTNNGNTWLDVNEGLTTKSIYKLCISGNYLLAGTNNAAVFRRPLNEFISTGINENKDNFNCTISPNPVSNTLTINASNELIGKKYLLKNVLGETILTDILTNTATELNVHEFVNGIYFLQLIGTNKTIKFVKE